MNPGRDRISPSRAGDEGSPSDGTVHVALIVEDDPAVARAHMRILKAAGFSYHWSNSAEAAEEALGSQRFDVVLLDLRLPGKSGEEFLKGMRAAGDHTGVLVVSGFGNIETKVSLLRAGADDFVSKPFEIEDLAARIHALARRSTGQRVRSLLGGRLELDPASTSARCGELTVRLSATEFGILWLLSDSPLAHVSTARIMEEVFGDLSSTMTGSVKTTISRIRARLASIAPDVQLESQRDAGYRLVVQAPRDQ